MIYILSTPYNEYMFLFIFIAIIIGLIVSSICGHISEAIYKAKGYGEGYKGGFWLGFLLGLFGIIIAACMPSKKQIMLDINFEMAKNNASKRQKGVICKYCGHEIPYNENYCPNCCSKKLDYN